MASRITNPDIKSQSGVSFQAGSGAATGSVLNVNISKDDFRSRVSKLGSAGAFNGHAVEVWADGAVYDTVSGTYLLPGRDFNPGDVQRT